MTRWRLLEDLKQELSLLFSRPLWLSDATDDAYRRQAMQEVRDRCARARKVGARKEVAGLGTRRPRVRVCGFGVIAEQPPQAGLDAWFPEITGLASDGL